MRALSCVPYHACLTMRALPCVPYHTCLAMRALPCVLCHACFAMRALICLSSQACLVMGALPCVTSESYRAIACHTCGDCRSCRACHSCVPRSLYCGRCVPICYRPSVIAWYLRHNSRLGQSLFSHLVLINDQSCYHTQ